MVIINDNRATTGWITAIIEDRWVEAKVYDLPSAYGVRNCRVSKIAISKTYFRDPESNFFNQMCYNYDRGLDFHRKKFLTQKKLNSILDQLNALPTVYKESEVN